MIHPDRLQADENAVLMIKRAHRSVLTFAALSFLGSGAAWAVDTSKSQWRCGTAEDGSWACEAAELSPGPFPAMARAPIYKKPPSQRREEAKRGQVIPQGGQSYAQAELNWVPRRALPTEVAETLEPWCGGAYQPYEWPEEVLALDPKTAVIGLTADEASYTLGDAAELSGAVQLEQGARRVFAGAAHYDAVTRRLALEEGVSLEEPGLLVRGSEAKVDLESGDAELTKARFALYEGGYRGSAETFRRSDGKLEIERAQFTRCAPGDNAWALAAGHIEIPEGESFAKARNARLKVRNVPVFWAPYLKVPVSNERQSGWLFPRAGATGSNGFDISAPYYLNLAPNMDATLTPRYMSERGVLGEGEFRYRSGKTENVLGAAFMPEDNQYNGQLSFDEFEERILSAEAGPGVFQTTDRWLIQAKHEGVWLPGLSTTVDFAAVSDRDYFRDLGTDLGVTSKVQLDRMAEMKLQAGGTRMRLWAEDIQLLEEGLPEAYRRLPQLDAAFRSRVLKTPLIFGYDLQYAAFDRSDAQATETITGTRTHIAPRLVLPFERSWGFLRSEVAYQLTSYKLSNRLAGQEETPHRGLPTASLDAGLRFERDLGLGGGRFLQTVEPRLYYLYIEDEDQSALPIFDSTPLTFGHEQLFRENRFAGIDRIGDANQVTAALTSRLLSLNNGAELLTATVGRIAYFDDQNVTLGDDAPVDDSASGWVSDLVLRLGSGLDARALWVWDSPSSVRDQSMVQLRYRPDGRRVFNLSYRTRGGDIEQADAAFTWPVSNHLALIGRYYYDLEESSLIEAFGGLQYDDCCWRLRVVARSFERPFDVINPNDTDRESGVFFDVLMKGLAGFDSGVDSILSNGIRGYEEPVNGAVSL